MRYALKNAIVLDGTKDMMPQDDVIVLTNDDKIEAIVPNSYDTKQYEDIDLGGQYLMPGLVNLQVHLLSDGNLHKRKLNESGSLKMLDQFSFMKKRTIKRALEYAKTQLLSGVTTIRTVGSTENFDTYIRDTINEGVVQGPRMLTCNKPISVPGGHMAGDLAYEAQSDEDVGRLVNHLASQHVDFIKLMITNGILEDDGTEPGELKMPASYVRTAVIAAHELGLKVAAHVEGQIGLSVALDNGVDLIEHGTMLSGDMADEYLKNNAACVCTISPTIPYAYLDQDIFNRSMTATHAGEIVLKGITEGAKGCLERHIPVGLGTDASYDFVTHYDFWRELYYFTKFCDVDNKFALHTATCVNARILGKEYMIGTIESGKCADMIVCHDNPLEDLSALSHLSYVISRGQLIENPQAGRIAEVDSALDGVLNQLASY